MLDVLIVGGGPFGTAAAFRAKELGLYDWLLERSPRLFGRPEDVAARLNELGREYAMTDWIFYATTRGARVSADAERRDLIEKLSRGDMPRLA